MASSNTIGTPENESEFERRCCILFGDLIDDPNIKRVATRGKSQGGFDLLGTRNGDPDRPVGVQCKNKTKGGKLDLTKVESDIRRMLASEINVTEIFVVTTTANDIKHDNLAIKLRQEQKQAGRTVDIQIWGWDTLTDKIRASPAALQAFDPDHSASTNAMLDLANEGIVRHNETQVQLSAGFASVTARLDALIPPDSNTVTTVDAVLNEQLDNIRDLLNSGKPKSALDLLEKLNTASTERSLAIRARILANMGFAHVRLGNDRLGGDLMVQAYALNPDDPKIRAMNIFGLFLTGDSHAAITAAKATLADDPTNAMAAAHFYQAAALAEPDPQPDENVPKTLWADESVRLTRAIYLRQRGDERWRSFAHESFDVFPSVVALRRLDAEAWLEEVYERRAFGPGDEDDSDRRLLEKATQALRSLWDEARLHEDANQEVTISLAANLVTAYRALRELDAAETVLRDALSLAPADESILLAAAHIDIIRDRCAEAVAKLEPLPDSPQRTIAYVSAMAKLERWSDLAAFATDERGEGLNGLDRQGFDIMLLHARLASDNNTDVDQAFDDMLAAWPDDLVVLASIADLAANFRPSRFEELFSAALSRAERPAPLFERMALADLAGRHDRHSAVIDVLLGHVEETRASEQLAWLLHGFANARPRPDTHGFIERLPEEVLTVGRYARLAGAAEYNRGDLTSALRHLKRAVAADATDLHARLMLVTALSRDGQNAKARELVLDSDELVLRGRPIDRIRLAASLRREGCAARALDIAFKVACVSRDQQKIASSYPMLLFMSEKPIDELNVAEGVQPDFWFRLEGINTGDIEGILTDDPIPDVRTFQRDNAIALAVKGKAIGDEVVLPPAMGIERRYVVREIKHKWVWLAHNILKDHSARFPESSSIVQMEMTEGDVSPALEVVKRSEERNQSTLASYRDTALPLALVAPLGGGNVLALAQRIVADGGAITTCVGLHGERLAGQGVARSARAKGIVLDTFTVVTAYELELFDVLKGHFGRLIIARSSMDEVIEWRDEQALNAGRQTMSIGYEGEQAVRYERSPEDNDRQLERLNDLVRALQSTCDIAPDGGEALDFDTSTIDAVGLSGVLDPVRLAREMRLPLLSDDLNYRQLAALGGVNASTWLQPTLLEAKANELFDVHAYALATARLTARRHDFVSVDSRSLLELMELGDHKDDRAFELVASNIGGAKADLPTHIGVVVGFFREVWTLAIPSWRKGRACGRLIASLIRGRGADSRVILDALDQMLRSSPSLDDVHDQARQYLRDWRVGHFVDIKPQFGSRRGRGKDRR